MRITVIALDHPDYKLGLATYAAASERDALVWLRAYYESEFDTKIDDVPDAELEAFVARDGGYRVAIHEHDVEVPLYPSKPRSLQPWPPRRGVA